MGDDYADFKLSVVAPIDFAIGDYADIDGYGRFYLCEIPQPSYNIETAGYDYTIRLEPQYRIWRNKWLMLTPATGGESNWKLTDIPQNHLKVIIDNLKYHGFKYHDPVIGNDLEWTYSVDDEFACIAKLVSYSCNILSGLQLLAETYGCQLWIEENVIHLGKCDHGEYITFQRDREVLDIKPSGTDGSLPTRLIAFGGSDNVPPWYRKELVFKVTRADGNLIYDDRHPVRTSMFPAEKLIADPKALKGFPLDKSNSQQIPTTAPGAWINVLSVSHTTRLEAASWTFKVPEYAPYIRFENIKGSGTDWCARYSLRISGSYTKHYEDGTTTEERVERTISGETSYFPSLTAPLIFSWNKKEEIVGLPADMDITVTLEVNVKSIKGADNFNVIVECHTCLNASRLSYSSVKDIKLTTKEDTPVVIPGVEFNYDHLPETGVMPLILPEGQTLPVGTEFYLEPIRKGNIPASWWTKISSSAVVDAIASKKLRLPLPESYIDLYEGITDIEAIEEVVTFEDVYPKQKNVIDRIWPVEVDVRNDDGSVETYRYWCIMSDALESFDNSCILSDEELGIKFESGVLNGMKFGVRWHQNGIIQSNGMKCFEIVMNEDYGRKLPDTILYPAVGDEFVLLGFDVELLSEELISDAEEELKAKAIEYLQGEHTKGKTYDCTLKESYIRKHGIPKIGQRIRLNAPDLFPIGYLESRVIGVRHCMDIPEDNPVITVGEPSTGSRLTSMETAVDQISQIVEGGGFLMKSEAEQTYAKISDLDLDTIMRYVTENIIIPGYSDSNIEYNIQQWVEGKKYLTDHQKIFGLTFKSGKFDETLYNPDKEAENVSIPTSTDHIEEGSNKYFTDERAQGALKSTVDSINTEINKKLDSSIFEELFEKVTENGVTSIRAKHGLWTEEFLSIRGLDPDAGTAITGGATVLGQLEDVSLGAGLTDGQVLAYSAATGKWVNRTVSSGLDQTALASYLTTNNYAKKSDIPSLSGYALLTDIPDVSGYATRDWVTGKGYITGSALTGYATEEWVLGRNYLTDHQELHTLTIKRNGVEVGTFKPDTDATVNIPDVASAADLALHASDTTIHMTQTERTSWNSAVSSLSAHVPDTTVHVNATERALWNQTATNLSAILGSDSDTVINKWEEVVAFLDTYTEADTLAGLLSNKVDKVDGYGLSQNDFTDTLLSKLNGIEAESNKYVHPTYAQQVISDGEGTVVTSIAVNNLGHVLNVGARALVADDIPDIAIGQVSGLETVLDGKAPVSDLETLDTSFRQFADRFDSMFEKVTENGVTSIRAKYGLWTEEFLSVRGLDPDAGTGGTGTDYLRLDSWSDYTASKSGYVLSAKLGHELYTDKLGTAEAASLYQPRGSYLTAVTKAMVEGVLTGDIASHAHSQYLTATEADGLYLGKTEAVSLYQPRGSYLTSASLEEYATEIWVQQQGYLTQHQPLTGYATEEWVDGQGYVTPDMLSGYALKSEIPLLTGYATESWVLGRGYITSAALTGYATESWVSGKGYITGVTKSQVEAVLTGDITTHTHSRYLGKTEAVSLYQPKGDYLTVHQSLSNCVTLDGAQTISGEKTFTASIITGGTDINLGTSGAASDDSGDLVWLYGNGAEKMRIWSENVPASANGPSYRVYKKDGTQLYSGRLATAGDLSSYLTAASAAGTYLPKSSYTASDVLSKLLTVDGTNSGLDADTLDGYHSGSFALGSHVYPQNCQSGKWMRVAEATGYRFSGIINLTNHYNNTPTQGVTLVVNGAYFPDQLSITQIGGTGGFFQKARIVYPQNSSGNFYVEVFMTAGGSNHISINIANALGMEAVSYYLEGSIPSGYAAKEITLTTGMSAPAFTGAFAGDLSGNASTATRLQGSYSIWGQTFYGNNVDGLFRELSGSTVTGAGTVLHKILGYPASPFGLVTRIYDTGNISLQVQREASNAECFNLLLNPNGGKVGIRTLSPAYDLDVNGTARVTGNLHAGDLVVNGSSSLIGYVEVTDDMYVIGSITTEGDLYADGGAQISQKLNVGGEIYSATGIYTAGFITCRSMNTSDMRIKNRLRDLELSVQDIASTPLFEFTFKDSGKWSQGTSAQYMQRILPSAVWEGQDGLLAMDYGRAGFIYAATVGRETLRIGNAILLLQPRVENHEERIAALERENMELRERVWQLERI